MTGARIRQLPPRPDRRRDRRRDRGLAAALALPAQLQGARLRAHRPGRQKVVLDGGAFVLPIVHDVIPVNMNTLRLEVRAAATRR
jgi:uncharacterized membrane protein YqiK